MVPIHLLAEVAAVVNLLKVLVDFARAVRRFRRRWRGIRDSRRQRREVVRLWEDVRHLNRAVRVGRS